MEVLGNEDSALTCAQLNNKNQQLMVICYYMGLDF